jgi:hypothetical protein
MMPDRSQPIPLNQAAEQDITEALRKQPTVRIKDLPAQKPVPQRENQPMLPNQGESTRFTHKDTGVTIVAFGHDATRLKAENSHLLQASNKP